MKILKLIILASVFGIATPLLAQEKTGGKWVDNNLTFMVIDEKVRSRGMLRLCITDTSSNCINNLQSGYEVRVFDEQGAEIWAGKTAGREEMLKFPKPMKKADYLIFKAFKPWVVNLATGTRIYQDEPIEIKYFLDE